MPSDIFKDFSSEFATLDRISEMTGQSFEMFVEKKLIGHGSFRNMVRNPGFILHNILRSDEDRNVFLKVGNGTYLAGTVSIEERSNKFRQGSGGSVETSGRFTLLKSMDFSTHDPARYRCFIAAKKAALNTFRFFLESTLYTTHDTIHNKQCVRIRHKGNTFDVIQIKGKGYYVIDSPQEIQYEEFAETCFSIQQALGFVTGYMPGGKTTYFNCSKGTFEQRTDLRQPLKTWDYPIYTNPYGMYGLPKPVADAYHEKLDVLPVACFEKLVEQLHDDPAFSATMLMMLDAGNAASLLVKPSLYAVALESLSRIIIDPTEPKRPVTSSTLFKAISRKIQRVIDSFRDRYDDGDDPDLLKGRIADLNKAHRGRHISNDEKLRLPFRQLGIRLSDMDLEILMYRNELLHGNILLASSQSTSDSEALDNHLLYAGSRLYTLVSKLILKRLDYSGYIINHAKAVEKSCNIITDEEYFLLI